MAKKVKKKELGLGIRALLNNNTPTSKPEKEVVKELSSAVAMIPVEQISAFSEQPRSEFADEPLQELAESIRIHGLIQPVTLRHMGGNDYQLISGERRLRASKRAGLTEIPAYIRVANDQEMLEMALIENIQRESLNAMEISLTYGRLKEEFSLTDEELAKRVGKSRESVTSYIGFLNLPESIQNALKKREISAGHAKAIKGLKDFSLQMIVFNKVINQKLSVRATEALVKSMKSGGNSSAPAAKNNLSTEYQHIKDNLTNHLGAKIELKLKPKGKGQIVINFKDTDDLNRLLDLIED